MISPRTQFFSRCLFPHRPVHSIEGREMANFLGPVQNMYSLTLLCGYKTNKMVNFKHVMIFFPSSLYGHLCFRGKWEEKARPKAADTEMISEQCNIFLIL